MHPRAPSAAVWTSGILWGATLGLALLPVSAPPGEVDAGRCSNGGRSFWAAYHI